MCISLKDLFENTSSKIQLHKESMYRTEEDTASQYEMLYMIIILVIKKSILFFSKFSIMGCKNKNMPTLSVDGGAQVSPSKKQRQKTWFQRLLQLFLLRWSTLFLD